MKNLQLSIALLIFFTTLLMAGCRSESQAITTKQDSARTIVKKSTIFSDPNNLFPMIKEISYQKTTKLEDNEGQNSMQIVRDHLVQFQDRYSTSFQWEEEGQIHKVNCMGDLCSKYINDKHQPSEQETEMATKLMLAAKNEIIMPYHLLKNDVELIYEGEQKVAQIGKCKIVKVNYSSIEEWYYFDRKTYRLLGNKIKRGDDLRLFVNSGTQKVAEVGFQIERKEFLLDSDHAINSLVARHQFANIELDTH